jgi:hypothetical protein
MPERSFDQLIKTYPPQVQALARETRELILDLMGDDAQESIDTSGPYAFYGYAPLDSQGLARDKPGYRGLVCSVILSKTGVKLGLSHGATLEDPDQLLEGAGKVHKHIPLKSSADLKKPPVQAIVKAAIKRFKTRG